MSLFKFFIYLSPLFFYLFETNCIFIPPSPNSSTDSSPKNVLTYISLGQEGLTELRNVRDSAAPRSYVDWRSRAFSDSRARGSARLEATWIKPREERVRYLPVASWAWPT